MKPAGARRPGRGMSASPSMSRPCSSATRCSARPSSTSFGSRVLRRHALLEITEGVMLQNTGITLATLRRLQAFGIRLAMDDFGTGYSSIGYLQKFRFDKIKIDRSFTARVDEDPHAEAIVRAVIDMSE